MTIVSLPVTMETVAPLLKHDEEIVCLNAIVTIDSHGEVTWWDRRKMINIVCKEGEQK